MEKRKYLQPKMKELEEVIMIQLLQESPPPGGTEDPEEGEGF